MSFPRHTLAEADATVAAAGFASTSVDAAERCVDCRRLTRRKIVDGAFYCSAPAHVRRAIEAAKFHRDHEAASTPTFSTPVGRDLAALSAMSDAELTAAVTAAVEVAEPAGAPCSHCSGPTIAATPGRPEEEGDYCPACGTVWSDSIAEPATPAPTIDYATMGGHALARLAREGDAAAKAEQRWRANRVLGMAEPRPTTSTPDEAEAIDTITNRRDLLAAVEVQVRHLGYTSAAAYLQAPGREIIRARVEVAASDPDGPALPAVDDDPREQPRPVEWSEVATPVLGRPVALPRVLRYR